MASESDASKHASPWHRVTPDDAPSAPAEPSEHTAATTPQSERRVPDVFDTNGLTPAKPPRPSVFARVGVPTPIEADAAELVPAVTLPDAAETFPTAPVTTEIEVGEHPAADAPTGSIPTSPYLAVSTPSRGVAQASTDDASGENPEGAAPANPATASAPATGSIRKLAPSAAALLSVGELPLLDNGEPGFVPRFEPTPANEEHTLESPLAHASLEESHEPAYTPPFAAPPSQAAKLGAEQPAGPQGIGDESTTESLPEDTMADGTRDEAPGESAGQTAVAAGTVSEVSDSSPESAASADAGDGGFPMLPAQDGDGSGASGSFWTSTAFLVIVGILVMAGIGYGVYALFFKPADVVLPAQTVVSSPVEPTLTPVVPTDASDFLAAMPTSVGAYALTEYTSKSAVAVDGASAEADLGEGVAEQVTLTYSDGTDEIVVDAWQHYDIGAAQTTFEGLNVDGTDPQPVTVDGAEVGVQVNVASAVGPTVLWMNATAVFSASGGGDGLNQFVDGFGY